MRVFTLWMMMVLSISLHAEDGTVDVKLTGEHVGGLKQKLSVLSDTTIRLTVMNADDTPFEYLKASNVTITRNGNMTEILKLKPLAESEFSRYNVILCLDNSTSMDVHSEALLNIVDTLLSCFSMGGNVTTVFFNERFSDIPNNSRTNIEYNGAPLKVAVRDFKNDFAALRRYCRSLYPLGLQSRTYWFDQVYAAFKVAASLRNKKEDTFIIILSDGEDNSSKTFLEDVIAEYRLGKVYAINFSNKNKTALQELTARVNGIFYDAQDAVALAQRFAQIRTRIVFSGYDISFREFYPPEITSEGFYELKSSQYHPVERIAVEEVRTREFFPLLQYVFFEKNADTLSPKYIGAAGAAGDSGVVFDERSLPPLQLPIYNNILNIVGSRMQTYADARITLTGCNDNDGPEKNNKQLSRRRAETVGRFLMAHYGIDSSRITIKAVNLPLKASAAKIAQGMEENRRVEITASDDRILDPVEVIAVTKISTPPNLTINLKSKSSTPIDEWDLSVVQGQRLIYKLSDKGVPPLYSSWNIAPSIFDKAIDSSDFRFIMRIKDKRGLETKTTLMSMPVSYVSSERKQAEFLADKTIEKLSLVLFDFNSAKLDKRNQSMLQRIENAIQPTSILKMNGFTDSVGTEPLNAKLSQDRAANSLKELVKLVKPVTTALSSEGFGELAPLYDNGLPEGRFYNRTCQLVIETPVEQVNPFDHKNPAEPASPALQN